MHSVSATGYEPRNKILEILEGILRVTTKIAKKMVTYVKFGVPCPLLRTYRCKALSRDDGRVQEGSIAEPPLTPGPDRLTRGKVR